MAMEHPFLRNEMLWGPEAQRRLFAAHVILFGLGGVGSYTAECLARAGIGELTIVDSDTVSLTNLNRQLSTPPWDNPRRRLWASGCWTSTPT